MCANITLLGLTILVPIAYSCIVRRIAWRRAGKGWGELYPGVAMWISIILYGAGGMIFYALLYEGFDWNNQAATAALVFYIMVAIAIMTYRLPS